MRLWLLIVIPLIIAIPLRADPIETMVLRALEENGRTVNLQFINGQNRAAIITILRDIATQKRKQFGAVLPDDLAAKIILLRLADPDTIERAVTEYHTAYGGRGGFNEADHLEWSAQAAILVRLSSDFFLEDGEADKIRGTGDRIALSVPPLSIFSAFKSLRIITRSDQFSPEMRQWAKNRELQGIAPYVNFRKEMRILWKQNEAAFKAGIYLAVKPPVPEPSPSPPDSEDSKK